RLGWRLRVGARVADRGSLELDAVGVVEQAVADGVGEVGIPDGSVPVLRGDLTGDEGGGALGAVLDDLDQVSTFVVAQGSEEPIVDREQVESREAGEGTFVGSVAPGHPELLEQSGPAPGTRPLPPPPA